MSWTLSIYHIGEMTEDHVHLCAGHRHVMPGNTHAEAYSAMSLSLYDKYGAALTNPLSAQITSDEYLAGMLKYDGVNTAVFLIHRTDRDPDQLLSDLDTLGHMEQQLSD